MTVVRPESGQRLGFKIGNAKPLARDPDELAVPMMKAEQGDTERRDDGDHGGKQPGLHCCVVPVL